MKAELIFRFDELILMNVERDKMADVTNEYLHNTIFFMAEIFVRN